MRPQRVLRASLKYWIEIDCLPQPWLASKAARSTFICSQTQEITKCIKKKGKYLKRIWIRNKRESVSDVLTQCRKQIEEKKILKKVIEMKAEKIRLNSARIFDWFTEWTRIIIYYIFFFSFIHFFVMPGGCHIRVLEHDLRTHNDMKSISFARSVNLSAQRLTRELMWMEVEREEGAAAAAAICMAEEIIIIK